MGAGRFLQPPRRCPVGPLRGKRRPNREAHGPPAWKPLVGPQHRAGAPNRQRYHRPPGLDCHLASPCCAAGVWPNAPMPRGTMEILCTLSAPGVKAATKAWPVSCTATSFILDGRILKPSTRSGNCCTNVRDGTASKNLGGRCQLPKPLLELTECPCGFRLAGDGEDTLSSLRTSCP